MLSSAPRSRCRVHHFALHALASCSIPSSTCAYAITMASHRSYQADPTPPRLSFSRYRPQNPRISPEDGERAMIVGPGRVAACPAGPPRSTEAHCRTQGVGSRPGDSRPWVPWPTGPRTDNSRVSSTARCPRFGNSTPGVKLKMSCRPRAPLPHSPTLRWCGTSRSVNSYPQDNWA
jgi:hypothetical protein